MRGSVYLIFLLAKRYLIIVTKLNKKNIFLYVLKIILAKKDINSKT